MGKLPIIAALLLAACSSSAVTPAPPRDTSAPPVVSQPSQLDIPITVRVSDLTRALEREVPRTLWAIDEQQTCLAGQRILKGKLKITPDVSCRVVGAAVRGPISVRGAGDVLTITMPVDVQVQARDIGKVIERETATAAARIRMTARLGMTARWEPTAKIEIDYRWSQVPGIDFLGQRIRFGQQVDKRLAPVVARLERQIPAELRRLDVRGQAAKAWEKGFASRELNRRNPPVWLRLTPQRIGFGGYRISGDDVRIDLIATALTETFVGPRPEASPPTPLPPLVLGKASGNARLFVPVIASYSELEPVLARALGKLSAKGVAIPSLGRASVTFGKVAIYGTTGGRIAVGLDLAAVSPNGLLKPKGRVWLTGLPVTAPGSRLVSVRDLKISGATDSPATNLLAAIAVSDETRAALEAGLTENFERDYQEVLAKANAALASRREGDLLVSAVLTNVENGPISAYGEGLYMPVTAGGRATVRYMPRR